MGSAAQPTVHGEASLARRPSLPSSRLSSFSSDAKILCWYCLPQPFVERLYALVEHHKIAVTPCEHQGTRFLDYQQAPSRQNMTPVEIAQFSDLPAQSPVATARSGGMHPRKPGLHPRLASWKLLTKGPVGRRAARAAA
jgi:hypothetical protein